MKTDIDNRARAQITKNIDCAFRLVLDIVDDPSILDEIPDDATMVLRPPDTPDLAEANRQGGIRLERRGHNVTFRHMPSRSPAAALRFDALAQPSDNAGNGREQGPGDGVGGSG